MGVIVDQDTDAVAPAEEGGMKNMPSPTQGLSKTDPDRGGQIEHQLDHSAPFWIVDKHGLIPVGLDVDAKPVDMVTNIRALLRANIRLMKHSNPNAGTRFAPS